MTLFTINLMLSLVRKNGIDPIFLYFRQKSIKDTLFFADSKKTGKTGMFLI